MRFPLELAMLLFMGAGATLISQTRLPPVETYRDPPVLGSLLTSPRTIVSTPFGVSYQVNVSRNGRNIVGDAANEPSLCMDLNNPNRIAIGWRQFDTTNSDFRQAGFGFSTNGGVNWTFGGTLETNVYRSDPVLASDAQGRFYYLSLYDTPSASLCDLWRSTNGGAGWQRLSQAYGGDKPWMAIDTSGGPAQGSIYETYSAPGNFTYSRDGGLTWAYPYYTQGPAFHGTLDTGPVGELYVLGYDFEGDLFWFNRSLNATNPFAPVAWDLTVPLDFGGQPLNGVGPNPGGGLGQSWVAVDRSTNRTRGNVYALSSVGGSNNLCDVMFARSTNRGTNWTAPRRINTDPGTNAWHWFGTLSVAPNGRIDACWFDTRISAPINNRSELYYCYSLDGGLSWATNRAISPPFYPALGYPQQDKIGEYITMISLEDGPCIAYSATFNREEDIYFIHAVLDLTAQPTIAAQPQDQDVVVGDDATFTVGVTGTPPLYYQWWFNSAVIPGATDESLTLTNVQTGDAGLYSVWVSNRAGFLLSSNAELSVLIPAAIVSQPRSQIVGPGGSATFSVIASGTTPLGYQWRFGTNLIAGATSTSFTRTNAQAGDAGNYSVTVSNAYGQTISSNALLLIASVAGWGDDSSGQIETPLAATNLAAISAGRWHSLALRTDGSVVAWGDNSSGQTAVPFGLNDVLAIAAGGYHSLALRANGAVVGWGANDSGQITTPPLSGIIGIAAGAWHSLALTADGSVAAWGDNTWGQTNVPSGLGTVQAIAVGGNHCLALLRSGTVVAWGENTDAWGNYAGQSRVPDGLTNVMVIAAGDYHSLALKSDGTIIAWGDNSLQQCNVPAGLSGVVAIAAGGGHSLALRADGSVVAWGDDVDGQLDVPSNPLNAVGIAAGEAHTLIMFDDGSFIPHLLISGGKKAPFRVVTQSLYRHQYALEFRDTLQNAAWTGITNAPGNGGLLIFSDPTPLRPMRFYRIRQQ